MYKNLQYRLNPRLGILRSTGLDKFKRARKIGRTILLPHPIGHAKTRARKTSGRARLSPLKNVLRITLNVFPSKVFSIRFLQNQEKQSIRAFML